MRTDFSKFTPHQRAIIGEDNIAEREAEEKAQEAERKRRAAAQAKTQEKFVTRTALNERLNRFAGVMGRCTAKNVGEAIGDVVGRVRDELLKRIEALESQPNDALEKRIAELETALEFRTQEVKELRAEIAENHTGLSARLDGLSSIEAELAEQKSRVDKLLKRPQLRYRDVWVSTKTYTENSICTHQGGLWLCQRKTQKRPGLSDDWRLIVKSGSTRPHRSEPHEAAPQ